MIPRMNPHYDVGDIKYLFSSEGEDRFIKAFADFVGNKFAISFPYGRVALYAFLKAMEIKNEEIIMPAYTCGVVAASIVQSGNKIKFVDISIKDFNMDLDLLKKAINGNTRALIITHLFGNRMNLAEIKDIIEWAEKKYNTKYWIIQDLAHLVLPAENDHELAGFGDVNFFGLSFSKPVNAIYGGIITTDNELIFKKIKIFKEKTIIPPNLSRHFRSILLFFLGLFFNYSPVYKLLFKLLLRFKDESFEINGEFPDDWNRRLPSLNFRIGLSQLGKYSVISLTRQKNCERWRSLLKNKGVYFPEKRDGSFFSHCVGLVEDRNRWIERFLKLGVELTPIYEYAVPYIPAFRTFKEGEYPIAKYVSEHNISFPIHSSVNERVFQKVVRMI